MYILGTKGKIRTMIGIDFGYGTPEQREASPKQPRWAICQIFCLRFDNGVRSVERSDYVTFRDATGVPSPDEPIPFTLADFAHSDEADLSAASLDMTHQDFHETFVTADTEEEEDAAEDFENDKTSDYNGNVGTRGSDGSRQGARSGNKRKCGASENADSGSKRATRMQG
ncbi:hypothetical protein G6011_08085 [Alternaria panax]|uniref:Uncharacterized protein n=1 Tax=Alternaria panax TaxID=48097 RepID=A0AAD4FH87_9PLEO|nr:hypothetical protein G6011_08085 [Alternaria panax]